jgi:hypothetical protein
MSEGKPTLLFLGNEAGEEEGLGHAGIETYKDAPYASVARECGQNSSDARAGTPVVMRFDVLSISKEQYPLHKAQLAAIENCLRKAKSGKVAKDVDFFTRAKEVLSANEIVVLRISDENTKGLVGPAVPGTPFHSLTKGSGVSSKDSDTSGGSFGIGKNAAFAVSELQTVFYSTVYTEPKTGESCFLAQGKTILTSHMDQSNKHWRATGYWGLPGFTPVDNKNQVPAWMTRNEIGTSVAIAGFRLLNDWQHLIAASLLQNFFCAVYRGEIRFLIDDARIDINAATIGSLFRNQAICDAAEASDQQEEFEFSRSLFECLTSSESTKTILQVEGLGNVSVSILMRDNLPKRVCIIRNGMLITDNLANFGDKFSSFPLYRDFVALVEPTDDVGSALLKTLENPRHDGLSAERLSDATKRSHASRAMKTLAKAIRNAIKEQALSKPDGQIVIDELSEFFEDVVPANAPRLPGTESDPESFRFEPAESRRSRISAALASGVVARTGGGGAGKGGRGRRNRGSGAGKGRGSGGRGVTHGGQALALEDFRNVFSKSDPSHRRIYFTPSDSGDSLLEIRAAGMDSTDPLTVVKSDKGSLASGGIKITVVSGQRYQVDVEFAEAYTGPLELTGTLQQSVGSNQK